ncbi:hypothetical protein ACKWTF_000182 [Chironomus riparius]
MMNSSSTNTAFQNPQQIIRITYPRTGIDHRKPDEQSLEQRLSSFLVCPPQTSSSGTSSATVPQIMNILNPVASTVATTNTNNVNGMLPNAKKCTFHRQCLHIQQTGQQQQQQLVQNVTQTQQQTHQNFMPLQTPSQQLLHSQLLQQQQARLSSNQIPASTNNSIVNRNTTQANRDAISTNTQPPQLNAALLQDRYLLLDMVDGSSFYKCIDIQTQKLLVCKIATNPCSNLLTAHFRLDGHPNVNFLEKVIQNSTQSYLFFEPSQGDLHSHVRVRKRLRENEARRLFRQMCEVVKTCHEQGIVLRDLKLRKFVFADAERTHIKLESLEDAIVLDNPTEDLLHDKRGCPAYVSPEILRANTTYSGKAADMWSLGVILYTMLVGRYPFNDSEHASLFAKISRGVYVVPECLSSKARCIIRALLRRDPEERITSEDILYHPWLKQDDEYREVISSKTSSTNDDQCVPEWHGDNDCDDSEMNGGGSEYDLN